jgi:hypothetical protein
MHAQLLSLSSSNVYQWLPTMLGGKMAVRQRAIDFHRELRPQGPSKNCVSMHAKVKKYLVVGVCQKTRGQSRPAPEPRGETPYSVE